MDGLLSFLIFGGLFYVMMRYGYGWYFALVWVPLYNFFATRDATKRNSAQPSTGDRW